MVKRIEIRYPLSCSCEGESVVPESLQRGRVKLTDEIMQTYMDEELLKELIVGGKMEAQLRSESLELVVTFWSPNSLSDRVKSLLMKNVVGGLADGMGENGFLVMDGDRKLFYEVTDCNAIGMLEHDEERGSPYPAPFVAIAAARGDEDELRAAIEEHPDSINLPLQDGRTALHYSLDRPALLRKLLDAGANPNIVDVMDMTPLNLFLFVRDSSERQTMNIVQMLIDAGADPSIVDYKGDTAIDNAKASGKHFVLPLLCKSIRRQT